MLSPAFFLLCSLASPITAAFVKSQFPSGVKGFSYDANDDFGSRFPQAKALGFNSVRTFTAIAPGSNPPQPLGAFAAAHASDMTILVGLYLSAGDAAFQRELAALEAAIKDPVYGSDLFPNKIVGITVGNEDLYRQSANDPKLGAGDSVENIIKYVGQTRDLLRKYKLDTKIPVGHAETWSEWSNWDHSAPLLPKLDYAALNSFPYWEGHKVEDGQWAYEGAIRVSEEAAAQFKNGNDVVPVWASETGWPTKGGTIGDAEANVDNARTYYKNVGCGTLFSKKRNAWWFNLYGVGAGVDAGISWGVADAGGKALFDLKCQS